MSNTFGKLFTLTTYGESHGSQIGGVIDGCPSDIPIDLNEIQLELDRRKPGQSELVTSRNEEDIVTFHSGFFDGRTTGTPIHFSILNKDQRSRDYGNLAQVFRPSHADYTYQKKYGLRDFRGGGRSSARETACRVVAGALAKQLLASKGILIRACVKSVYQNKLGLTENIEWSSVEQRKTRAANQRLDNLFTTDILNAKRNGDSLGGQVYCEIKGLPVGLGEPVYDKFHARLGSGILSINACKGFEIGSGYYGSTLKGSDHNDSFRLSNSKQISTLTNYSGGVQGGITNGEDVYFTAAFKPIATIIKEQKSININLEEINFLANGRHDPCVLPRAVPIVEAMAAITTLDFFLIHQSRNF